MRGLVRFVEVGGPGYVVRENDIDGNYKFINFDQAHETSTSPRRILNQLSRSHKMCLLTDKKARIEIEGVSILCT